MAALCCAVPAHAGTLVVEGETLRGERAVVVRAEQAARGKVLLVRPGGVASRRVATGQVSEIVVRLAGRGCSRRTPLLLSIDGGTPLPVPVGRRFAERRLKVALAPGPHRLRVALPRRTRCRTKLDRLRLPAAPAPAGAPAPVPAPAPATAPSPARRVPLGTAVQLAHLEQDPALGAALASSFSSFSPENELKMEWTQPRRDVWDFAAADELVAFARTRRLQVRGHTLVFGTQTPLWVARLLFSSEVDQALQTHVRTVMTRYKDSIREWDVVNEAFDARGQYRSNPFYDRLGPSYVEKAFAVARQVDPTAKLFYNELDADVDNAKRSAVVKLARHLKGLGLIDGVGLQLHTAIGHAPSRQALVNTMRIYEQMGLEVQITEMDVDAGGDGNPETLAARLEQQAAVFRDAAAACAEVTACTRFTVWGVADKYSWLGADRVPLLLDTGFNAKPALGAVRETLGLAP